MSHQGSQDLSQNSPPLGQEPGACHFQTLLLLQAKTPGGTVPLNAGPGGRAGSVPTWAMGGCSLGISSSAPSSELRGPPPLEKTGDVHGGTGEATSSRLAPPQVHTGSRRWRGHFRPWARSLPASRGPHALPVDSRGQECRGDLAREEARALGWHRLEPRRASHPLPGGFPGAHVSGPPPLGGISPRSLSLGHPVPAGADSQHTPDKLDTPTLKIPDGSYTRGAQWQAPHAGAVVPLLVSASERDASGSFASWHPRPRTACPCCHLLCPPGMRAARGRL